MCKERMGRKRQPEYPTRRHCKVFARAVGTSTGLIFAALGFSREASAQTVLLQNSSQNFSEAYAYSYVSPQGVQEMIAPGIASQSGTMWYACNQNNNYSGWYNWNIGYTGDIGDPSGFSRTTTKQAVLVSLQSNQNGPRWYWSNDACPPSGSPGWYYWNYNTDSTGSVDYTHSAYDPAYDQMAVTYTQNINGKRRMVIGRISSNFEGFTWYWSGCSNIANHNITVINSTFDANGDEHIVYKDETSGNIQYEKYTRTGGFQCINKVIGPWSNNLGSCATCDRPTYQLAGQNTCLRQTWAPSIAWDDTTGTNLVITYSTPGSGSCQNTSNTRVYQSSDLGNSWSWTMVSGCQNSLQPRATFSYNYMTQQTDIHVVSIYATQSSSQLAQVDWHSINFGSWSGVYLTSGRTVTPLSGCYWGDYEGAAFDYSNDVVFYDWGQSGSSTWVLDGLTVTP